MISERVKEGGGGKEGGREGRLMYPDGALAGLRSGADHSGDKIGVTLRRIYPRAAERQRDAAMIISAASARIVSHRG